MMKNLDFDLYFITDRNLSKHGVVSDVESVLRAGVKFIQYREKEKSFEEMVKEARKIKEMCDKYEAKLIINDRFDVALEVDADGVHLGPDDADPRIVRKAFGGEKIIGLSVKGDLELAKKMSSVVDYVSIGPIFRTNTKKSAGKPLGLEIIKKARKELNIPFVVIGGINEENLFDVLKAGARGVCMISGILRHENVEENAKRIRNIILKNRVW